MDYEKKYKEALDWIKSLYPTMAKADREDAEHYFSELRESEDEKIRKAIIKHFTVYFTNHKVVSLNDVSTDAILSWLEKQKPESKEETVAEAEEGLTELDKEIKRILFEFHNDATDGLSFHDVKGYIYKLKTVIYSH